MAREIVTIALVIDYDDESCIEDILSDVCATNNAIQSFDILDICTADEDEDE